VTSHSAPASAAALTALFVGLCRMDAVNYLARGSAGSWVWGAGGPAAGAAVTFAFLGGRATLLTGLGRHSRAGSLRADLRRAGVRLIDAAEDDDTEPALTFLRPATQVTDPPEGPFEVFCIRSPTGPRLSPPPSLDTLVTESRVVLIDSHHPGLANAAVRAAREHRRLCLVDGRDWNKVTPHLLPFADVAVCSADSRLRDRHRRVPKDMLGFLLDSGASWAAITDGPRPIRWASRTHGIQPDIPVPETEVADTLWAGDIFHGALTHAVAALPVVDDDSFGAALQFAARVAAYSCQSFGTRTWMNSWTGRP
jgi:sugar/nucleoside kinase (ribokinase family)